MKFWKNNILPKHKYVIPILQKSKQNFTFYMLN